MQRTYSVSIGAHALLIIIASYTYTTNTMSGTTPYYTESQLDKRESTLVITITQQNYNNSEPT